MLRLRTFGGAALLDESGPLAGAAVQKRRLALLSLLAVAGPRGMSRDKIAGLLWPESDQERARHSLSQWLFTTRRDLKVEDLLLGTAELRLNPERISSDVGELEQAIGAREHARVLECYAGPFLDGFHLSGAAEFERWVEAERATLAHRAQQALEALAAARVVSNDTAGALEVWRRLAVLDPYNGRISLGLMRALAASGDTAGALSHARVHTTLLREELGAEPQPDVIAFAEQLRLAPVPTPAAPAPGRSGSAPEGANAYAGAGAPDSTNVRAVVAPLPEGPVVPSPVTLPATTVAHVTPGRPRPRRLARPIAIATVLIALTLIGASRLVPGPVRAMAYTLATRSPTAMASRRVVVAPLENLSGDTALATFGYIASGWMTEELAETGEFEVVDAQTSYATSKVVERIPSLFRADDRAVALAEETGAGLLISGRYYRERDSIRVQVLLTDLAQRRVIRTLGHPVVGAVGEEQQLLEALARRVVGMAAIAVDTSAASGAIGRTFPSSYAGYRESTRAWERFYEADIAGFYRHAQRATQFDTSYMTPVMMQSYVRSDAREWPQADSLVRILEAHRSRLSDLEQAGTDMLAAAVRGDLAGHLRGAIAVTEAAPASAELRTYAARVAVNANQPRRALSMLAAVDPSRGVMLFAPWYWNWKSAAHHLLAQHAEELEVAAEGARRFPRVETATGSLGRALAAAGKGGEVRALLGRLPRPGASDASRRWKIALDWSRELRAHGHPAESRRLLETLHAELASTRSDGGGASRYRATVLGDLGRHAEAYAAWTSLAAREPHSLEVLGNLGVAAVRAGDMTVAATVDDRIARGRWDYAHGRDALWRARIAAAAGRTSDALLFVEQALGNGFPRFFDPGGGPHDEPDLHADPVLQPLMRNASFRALLAPKG